MKRAIDRGKLFFFYQSVAFKALVFGRVVFAPGELLPLTMALKTLDFLRKAQMVLIGRNRDYRFQGEDVQY